MGKSHCACVLKCLAMMVKYTYYNQFNHRGYNDNLRPNVPPKWNHFFFQTLASPVTKMAVDPLKEKALADYKKKLMEHREVLKEMVWTLKRYVN